MKMKYKAVMFLTLLIFCVGSVCATEPDNTTGDGGLNPVNPTITNTTDVVKIVNSVVGSELEKRDTIIQNQELRIKNLENSSAEKDVKINELNNTVNGLKIDNEALKDNNTQLDKRVKTLEDSNKQLVDSNKILNNTVNNQAVKINELNNKLELQLIEINILQSDKDKLNVKIDKLNEEIKENYKKLLESPKKEDFEQLKAEIDNKDKQIEELNTQIDKLNNEINTLKAINSISRNDVVNSLKDLSSTNIQNIKCGKYTFKLEDYLKIPLIKEGKKNVLKFKKGNGRLPNYVMIAGYKVPKNVYQKLYNI